MDYVNTDNPTRRVNGYLDQFMTKKIFFLFIQSYRPFKFRGQARRELFAEKDGGIQYTDDTHKLPY